MSSAALCSLYEERLGPEWANVSLSRSTFVAENVFEAVAHLVPAALKARFLGSDEDERACVLFDDIFDHLNSIAPLDCYFGPHVGNASDYGFWSVPEHDQLAVAHKIIVDGKVTHRLYCDTTDSYSDVILLGDLYHCRVSEEITINTAVAIDALDCIADDHQRGLLQNYIRFLERSHTE